MSRKNILVVDDEKSQREILEMILTSEGYDVTTASSRSSNQVCQGSALRFGIDRSEDDRDGRH